MKSKIFALLVMLLAYLPAFAQENQSQCNTCTNGYAIALTGDVTIAGTLLINKAVTMVANQAITGALTVTGLITGSGGYTAGTATNITDTASLTTASCGVPITVTAAIDGKIITLPEASTVIGCTYTVIYSGANGAALLTISPLDSDADGIVGSCTLAGSIVSFSGTADADVKLTKATGLKGDYIKLTSVDAATWMVTGCQGIWAN